MFLHRRTYVRYREQSVLHQTSFDELGTPLSGATFCVLDLETTGGSPEDDSITEVAALKVRRGEVVGSFQTLVNPQRPVPAFIRALTGISNEDLVDAEPIDAVLPSLLEFVKGTVLVAHNARFDVGFINIALTRLDYPRLTNRVLDTALLARKILAGEVPNHRLSTLAGYLRTAHQPCHRAMPDVLATVDLLHHLIERVAGFGITTLEDFCSISSTRLDGTFRKITLAADLPRGIGVYRFLGSQGQTLYVGKATDVRSRVRSYFFGDPRRRMRDLLRETQDLKIEQHATLLEAEVAEARAIALEKPPYNRRGKNERTWYVKIASERSPKVATARTPKEDGSTYLGPFPSMKTAKAVIDALRTALPIHRCTEPRSCNRCAFHEFGTCAGGDADAHRAAVDAAGAAVVGDFARVLQPLRERMWTLADKQRFEEAEEVRSQAAFLASVMQRASEIRCLQDAGDVVIACDNRFILVRNGRMVAARHAASESAALRELFCDAPDVEKSSFLSAVTEREAAVIAGWFRKQNGIARLVSVSGTWAMPVTARPTFDFRCPEKGERRLVRLR
ncbi:MAG: polymerase subunit epsilon [Actinomycetota bacterium]|nr:polymerase subunit epsilon [Actinomycetota bacterium]